MIDKPLLLSVMVDVPSSVIIRRVMEVMFQDAKTVLDVTYGSGRFWPDYTTRQILPYRIVSVDIDPTREPDIVADFRNLDCRDALFDVVCFDPPYISNPGEKSVMAAQFGSYPNAREMEAAVRAGAAEAWRVCRLGIIVKVQNHIHGAKLVHMTRWVEESIPEPLYDEVHAVSSRLIHMKQRDHQFSAIRNHATYLIFRKGSQYHRRRRHADPK